MSKESYEKPVMTFILLPRTGVVLTSCPEDETCFGFGGMCSGYEEQVCIAHGGCEGSDGCEDTDGTGCGDTDGTGTICSIYDPNSGATAPCEADLGGIGNG